MKKSELKQLFRDYFTLTRSERNGMLVLCSVLLISVVLDVLSERVIFKKPADQQEFLLLMNKLEQLKSTKIQKEMKLFLFNPNTIPEDKLDSLAIPEQVKKNLIRYREKGGVIHQTGDLRKLYGMTDSIYSIILPYIKIDQLSGYAESPAKKSPSEKFFEFDPNSVTEDQLKLLGFNTFQTRNLLEFRKNGGRFRHERDILKIYGIDSIFFMKIRKWLVIRVEESNIPEKQEIQRIELNLADSAGLTSLRGIGPAFAHRIIQFRKMLGGFYSVTQLQEVYGMTEDRFRQLSASVNADPSLITFISLNFTDFSTLSRHPYISGAQARKIIEWRSANGPFSRKEILMEAGILDDITFRKIEPYLKCE